MASSGQAFCAERVLSRASCSMHPRSVCKVICEGQERYPAQSVLQRGRHGQLTWLGFFFFPILEMHPVIGIFLLLWGNTGSLCGVLMNDDGSDENGGRNDEKENGEEKVKGGAERAAGGLLYRAEISAPSFSFRA